MVGDDHPHTRHWVADFHGRLVGALSLMPAPEPAALCPARTQLRGMAVHGSWQRRGVGRALLDAATADHHARASEPPEAAMWCNARLGAVAFYAAAGWEVMSAPFDVPEVGPHRRMRFEPRPAPEVLHAGRFLALATVPHGVAGRWEIAQRTRGVRVAAVLATTVHEEVVLVEQFRPPIGARVLELPAGLVGDGVHRHESPEEAARRELREETGFEAPPAPMELLTDGPSSAGLSDERVWVFLARQCRAVGGGGGVDEEQIVVHRVPMHDLRAWLARARARGLLIDPRVHAAVGWLNL